VGLRLGSQGKELIAVECWLSEVSGVLPFCANGAVVATAARQERQSELNRA
jgi:hypothetical protein